MESSPAGSFIKSKTDNPMGGMSNRALACSSASIVRIDDKTDYENVKICDKM